ncbi:LuxR C-terminal-related transcriptional regulator [Caulobacter sp. 1776]|uniref:LuxR C-terminal-related transcriptional regulator n=1 Tax=Caulobacter sp. 1776 TaxID=3156420 RepID=UPI0033958AFF
MPDLPRLSEAERRVLLLLARGHTAKSAATALGLTEGAVNERLREARRKTGVGSSRELARRVSTPQETWDDKIGVAAPTAHSDIGGHPLTFRVRWPVLLGALSMIILASAAGAFAALAVVGHAAPAGPPRVVQTYPAVAAEVAAGKIAIKVTFDQPMRPGGYSFVARDKASYPTCASTPTQSKDGRSFTLDCVVEPGKDYWIGFNSERFRNFTSTTGVPAVPAMLRFSAR